MAARLALLASLLGASCPWPPTTQQPPTTSTTTTTSSPTTTLPSAPACFAPQGVGWAPLPAGPSILPLEVNVAMARLTGCGIGSDCSHGGLDMVSWESAGQAERYVLEERAAQNWMAEVVNELRGDGLGVCAGQIIDGHSDGIVVAEACGGPYTEYKIANYGGGKVVWSPYADRGNYAPSGGRCDGMMPPTPRPPLCPLILDDEHHIEIRIKEEPGARVRLDATPFICGFPLPENWSCGTRCCGAGIDYGLVGLICERELVGTPIWRANGLDQSVEVTTNPFTVIVFGKGEVTACASKHPESCGSYVVQ